MYFSVLGIFDAAQHSLILRDETEILRYEI